MPAPILHLPNDLVAAIERALASVPAQRWVRAAHELSERYRGPRPTNRQLLATGADQALGYAALIMPATYAQLHGALAAAAARLPDWRPASMLDLGSGPGTALWVAAERWPSLHTLVAYERVPALIGLGRALARECANPAVRSAHWEQTDLATPTRNRPDIDIRQYDLVVIGHVLNELDPERRAAVVARAWQQTAGVLLIVEPGTAAAFEVVRAAREQLHAAGARTIAPCAHDAACPLAGDWCHFPQRLWRPEFQRRARAAPSQWEESKFAYAAMARFAPGTPIWGRVIREPSSNKAFAEVTISSRAGVARFRAPKRDRAAFEQVKNLDWGQALAEPLAPPILPTDEQPIGER